MSSTKKVFISILVFIFCAACSTQPAALSTKQAELPGALERFKTSQDPAELRAMLLGSNGEANDQPLLLDFAEWGRSNKKQFLTIIQYEDLKQKKDIGRAIGAALVKANKNQQFLDDFRGENTEVLNIIRAGVIVAQKEAASKK